MFLSLCIYATIFIWHWDVKSFSFWGFYLCLECICSIASFELLSLWWNGTQNLAFGLLFRHAQFERALFLEQIKFLIPQITHDLFLVNRVFFGADDNSLQFVADRVEGNLLAVGTRTKRKFKDFHLHLEFRTPYMPSARGQARGQASGQVRGTGEVAFETIKWCMYLQT